MPGDPGTADPNMPEIPAPGRSPFDLEPKTETPAQPATPGAQPLPERGQSPFDIKPGQPTTPGAPAGRTPPPTTLREMPRLPEVAPTLSPTASNLEPGAMSLAPEATLASTRSASRPNLGPLPDPNPAQVTDSDPIATMPAPVPTQAPQRRSLLGGLFGQGNRRRR